MRRLVLIGEVPGDKEDLAGHPFVGPAGKVLDEALEDAGIDRTQVYADEHGEALQVRAARQGAHPQEAERRRGGRMPASGGRPSSPPCSREVLGLLGAVAGQAVFGAQFRVTKQRGQWLDGPDGVADARDDPPVGGVPRAPDERRDAGVRGARPRPRKLIASRSLPHRRRWLDARSTNAEASGRRGGAA